MQLMKPILSFRQIINMNVGFFGIQYSFGLQQANMSPIYQYLGANESALPLSLVGWSNDGSLGSANYWCNER